MSQPKLPEINPDMTRDCALNMILASIAMEEAALSRIVSAEGEKLRYVLETLDPCKDKNRNVGDILAVNDSVTRLLESVSQNEMLLKNKMDKVLQAISEQCPCECQCDLPCLPLCPEKCSAVFKEQKRGDDIWREGQALPWKKENIRGRRILYNPNDSSKITLLSKCRYMISFVMNLKCASAQECKALISLRMRTENRRSDIFTHHCSIQTIATVSAGGIIIEPSNNACDIFFELASPSSLTLDSSILTIVEI